MIKLYGSPLRDDVLNALYWVGETTYDYAIESLSPLIQSLAIQRNLQSPSFYARLRRDLREGCVVPAITLAFITDQDFAEINEELLNSEVRNGFVLDGIQRLNAIKQAHEEIQDEAESKKFLAKILHLNVIVSPSMDRLLYRMITLNNGQKPMSPRHQIDILSETVFDFDTLSLKNQAHKIRQKAADKLAVQRSDVVKGYIAYLSDTTAIDNKLIIEEKMDSLIAERIIESNVAEEKFEFMDVLRWIATSTTEKSVNSWFVLSNNFIGFCVAARRNFEHLQTLSPQQMADETQKFEEVFSHFDKRKIKVGDYRRKMVSEYFAQVQKYAPMSIGDIVLELSQA